MSVDWDVIRQHKYSPDRPPEWPPGVHGISIKGVGLLGVDPATNKLYSDGKEILLRDRVRLGSLERILAVFVAIGTFGTFIVELGNALNWFPE
jgi:hypothetical protein